MSLRVETIPIHHQMGTGRNEMLLDPIELVKSLREIYRFRDYQPQSVTFTSINSWLDQFKNKKQRQSALFLLSKVKYFSEKETRDTLVELNESILKELSKNGIGHKKVVYVSLDDAGSSSPALLALLRDKDRLERKGCSFYHSRDIFGILEKTNALGEGAIVYVDDFAGTGNQFVESRKYMASNIPMLNKFSEFIILPAVCQEAFVEINKLGVVIRHSHIHSEQDRPLHPRNTTFDEEMRESLTQLCESIDKGGALGYRGLATMVAFYRNSPNTMPILFRGDVGQKNFKGIIPRTTDLPPIAPIKQKKYH